MDNKNKKINKKQYIIDNENINNTLIPYETIRLLNNSLNTIPNSLIPIVNLTNTINTIPNSLIPIMDMTNKYTKLIDDVTLAYQTIHPVESFIKMMQPVDIIERYTLTQQTLNQIHNSFNSVDWIGLNATLNNILQSLSICPFDFILDDKKIHTTILYQYVCEIDDDELSSIFTYEFLFKIINDDWWIIPTFDLEYYKKISKSMESNLNQSFLNEFYDNPNLIKDMVLNWNITSNIRKTIINQALFNYMNGHFEICVMALVLQIEGIMKEKISYKKSTGELRASLEQELKNKTPQNPWNQFLRECNIKYIWEVLNPIDDKINFKDDIGIVNRNEIAHMGIVEADQLIAMRLFFIIDTLMYIFETI